jgi:hypothetical protein
MVDYQSSTEQQFGVDNFWPIKIFLCPECGHKKSVCTKKDLAVWKKLKKYKAPTQETKVTFNTLKSNEGFNQRGLSSKEYQPIQKHNCDGKCDCDDNCKKKCKGCPSKCS